MRRFIPRVGAGSCLPSQTAALLPHLHRPTYPPGCAALSPSCSAGARAASSALKSSRVALRKRFGQHLLKNADVVKNIVDAADIQPHESVFEIGPGTGNMTIHMLPRARCVYAAELDSRLAAVVTKRVAGLGYADRFFCINQDFLKVPLPAFDKLVANIPYQISSPVLTRLFTHVPLPKVAIIMFQLEFAERMVAQPGTAQYSRLSVNCALMSHRIRMVMKIGREQFRPPPKVDSAVVEIVPAGPPAGLDFGRWDAFLRIAFSGKNKRLRSVLTNKHVLATLLAERAAAALSPPGPGGAAANSSGSRSGSRGDGSDGGDGGDGGDSGNSGDGGSSAGFSSPSAVASGPGSSPTPHSPAPAPAPAPPPSSSASLMKGMADSSVSAQPLLSQLLPSPLLPLQLLAGWKAAQQRLTLMFAAAAASAASGARLAAVGAPLLTSRSCLLLGASNTSAAGYHTSASAAAPSGRGSRDAHRNRSGRGNFERAAAAASAFGAGTRSGPRSFEAAAPSAGRSGSSGDSSGWDAGSSRSGSSRSRSSEGADSAERMSGRPQDQEGFRASRGGSSVSRDGGSGSRSGSGSGSGARSGPRRSPFAHAPAPGTPPPPKRSGSGPRLGSSVARPSRGGDHHRDGRHRDDGARQHAHVSSIAEPLRMRDRRNAGGSARASGPWPDAASVGKPPTAEDAAASRLPLGAGASDAAPSHNADGRAAGDAGARGSVTSTGSSSRGSSPPGDSSRRGLSAGAAQKSRRATMRLGEPALAVAVPSDAGGAETAETARRRKQRRSLLAESTAGDLLPLSTAPLRPRAAGSAGARTASAADASPLKKSGNSGVAAAGRDADADADDVDVDMEGDGDGEGPISATVATTLGRMPREEIAAARASIDAVLERLGALDWRANGMTVDQFRSVFDALEAAGWRFPRAHERQFPSLDWGDSDHRDDAPRADSNKSGAMGEASGDDDDDGNDDDDDDNHAGGEKRRQRASAVAAQVAAVRASTGLGDAPPLR